METAMENEQTCSHCRALKIRYIQLHKNRNHTVKIITVNTYRVILCANTASIKQLLETTKSTLFVKKCYFSILHINFPNIQCSIVKSTVMNL